MSKVKIEIIKCDCCGETIKGRLDNNVFRKYSGVKSKDIEEIELDFCNSCWEYFVERSRNKKELFEMIEKETDWIICNYDYVGWNYDEEGSWKR